MARSRLHVPALERGSSVGRIQRIRPADAGWSYVGFEAHRLADGSRLARPGDDHEVAVLVLEGQADVGLGGAAPERLGGRTSVFEDRPPELALAAPGIAVAVTARSDALVALADAPGGDTRITRLIREADIPVEARGQGSTARRVHHLLPPSAEAGRLILFEVITPGGNWSSYPPHKHDTEDPPRESLLEELYFYRFARPEGWAFQRVYTRDGELDEVLAPRDQDVVLVPRGFHPVGLPAGYDGYYLNVMAGPTRAWHFTLDPDHAWLMDWDPRPQR